MKRHSVSVRINLVILALVVVIGGGLVTAAYMSNRRQVDAFYRTKASQTSATIAAYVDADAVSRLLEVFRTDEYQAQREKAAAAGDNLRIEQYLEEKGLLDEVRNLSRMLRSFRDLQGAKYVYLISAEEDQTISVCDPDEEMIRLGEIRPNAGEFTNTPNRHSDPEVTQTEYGWLCSAYDPVTDSLGNAVCLAGADIDMTEAMNVRHAFLWSMLSFAGVVGVIAIAGTVWMMQHSIARPLEMLSKATDEFGDPNVEFSRENVVDLPIKSKDEIGDLYRKTKVMQECLLDYMDDLTRVTTEKERISTELNVANRIQADMLPRIFPAFPNRSEFDIYAIMDPAKEVGGDFYDFFLVDDDHLAMVVADVSGKGVPAALFMVIAKTLIKNRAQIGDSPAEILYNVNNQLCEGNDAELFVTVWLGILEISTGKGWAVNAGHEHPVVRRGRDGLYELIVYKHSPAAAVMEGVRFKQHEFHLDPGDALFVYSDGVPEATSASDELFGNERMLQVLNANRELPPEDLLPVMHREIEAFVGEAPQFDDITMLLLEYKGSEDKKVEELEIEAKLENLNRVLAFLDEHLERRGCSMKTQTQLDIAVEEVFVNIASYAYGTDTGRAVIQLRETHDPEGVSVTFIDEGMPYDPLAKPDPDVTLSAAERPIGGLGIYMVKKSMDDMIYEYRDNRNTLTLKKNF